MEYTNLTDFNLVCCSWMPPFMWSLSFCLTCRSSVIKLNHNKLNVYNSSALSPYWITAKIWLQLRHMYIVERFYDAFRARWKRCGCNYRANITKDHHTMSTYDTWWICDDQYTPKCSRNAPRRHLNISHTMPEYNFYSEIYQCSACILIVGKSSWDNWYSCYP